MKEKIKQLVSEILEAEITDESSQSTVENWDSLRHLTLMFAIEETFNLEFDPEEIDSMKNVKKIEEMILKHVR